MPRTLNTSGLRWQRMCGCDTRLIQAVACCLDKRFQSASLNTPINPNTSQIPKVGVAQIPKIGVDGLLRVVEIIARIQADQHLPTEETAPCLSELSPPGPTSRNECVAQPACKPSQATDLDSHSDAGSPDRSPTESGAGR